MNFSTKEMNSIHVLLNYKKKGMKSTKESNAMTTGKKDFEGPPERSKDTTVATLRHAKNPMAPKAH